MGLVGKFADRVLVWAQLEMNKRGLLLDSQFLALFWVGRAPAKKQNTDMGDKMGGGGAGCGPTLPLAHWSSWSRLLFSVAQWRPFSNFFSGKGSDPFKLNQPKKDALCIPWPLLGHSPEETCVGGSTVRPWPRPCRNRRTSWPPCRWRRRTQDCGSAVSRYSKLPTISGTVPRCPF